MSAGVYTDLAMANVLTLIISQFFAAVGQVTVVALGGIIGASLAPDPRLATLPVSCAILGVAAATLPAALSMPRFGRRRVFICGVLLAASGALGAATAIATQSFLAYCVASVFLGANLAFTAQFRFAAAESVEPEYVSRVVAWVMLGIILAALIGPGLVVGVRDWTGTEYVASFLAISVTYGLSALVLTRYQNVTVSQSEMDGPSRSLRELARQPTFKLAVGGAAVSYGIMALIMTATPLSMHVLQGHSVEATTAVIQAHMLAMYLPSLVSGWLVARLGAIRMLSIGTLLEAGCVAFAVSGHQIMHYTGGMIALGVGWNLMFVASTTLLTRTYRPAERFRVQAFNDFFMFGVMAAASLLAGLLINSIGWEQMNLFSLLPLAALLFGLALFSRHSAGTASKTGRSSA